MRKPSCRRGQARKVLEHNMAAALDAEVGPAILATGWQPTGTLGAGTSPPWPGGVSPAGPSERASALLTRDSLECPAFRKLSAGHRALSGREGPARGPSSQRPPERLFCKSQLARRLAAALRERERPSCLGLPPECRPEEAQAGARRCVSMAGQRSASGTLGAQPDPGANADWMAGLCPRLWDVPLHHLAIPGSHDTMTYCLSRKSPVSHAQPRLLRALNSALPCVTRPVVMKWSVTQTLDVTAQLDAGVRYLDLRVAHMRGGPARNLHFVHMVYTSALVEDTLTEVCEWLDQHPREALVLACREFEGLDPELHEYLVACIRNIFGERLCPRGDVPTLRQLWERGQQVLLSYEEEALVARHGELWPGVPYWWGNQVKPEALIRYLETMKSCGRPGGLFVAGTNLTESLGYVLAHPAQSLATLTLPALPALSTWVREQEPGPGPTCTNIIAGDFIGADSFITDVIGLNQKLLGG